LKHFVGDEVGIIIVIITITSVAEAAIVDAALVAALTLEIFFDDKIHRM
jgi:hypothetical protein